MEDLEFSIVSIPPLSDKEINEAHQQFTIIDITRNGFLDEKELANYFRFCKKELYCSARLVIKIFGTDNTISYDQFLKFYNALSAECDSDYFLGRFVFDYIDTDCDGVIDSIDFPKEYNPENI